MAEAGKRYPLLVYEHILKRWYPAIFTLSIALAVFWWFLPTIMPTKVANWLDNLVFYSSIGALSLSIFFVSIRKMAYIRPYRNYLRLATPFFRVNISYKRIQKTTTTEMQSLFPASSLSAWTREQMSPLMFKTAIVLELKSFPLPYPVLRLFLSPYFFKDKSPHFVLLVEEWMRFSSEIESFRSGGGIEEPSQKKASRKSVLSSLTHDQ